VIAGLLLTALLQVATDPIDLEAFQRAVVRNHPVVQAADLALRRASLGVSLARGAFDPTVSATLEQKRFKGIGYFDEFDARLNVPTPLGIDFKLGWERADGEIINPERATPTSGLLTAAVVLPLGRRIITDERRTALTQAAAQVDAAVAERQQAILGLLAASARSFGAWYDAEQRVVIAREAERLAVFRLEAVRRRVAEGDAAAIDSIEARLEVRARQVARSEAENAAIAARANAEVFVWDPAGRAGALPVAIQPAEVTQWGTPPTLPEEDRLLTQVMAGHPAVVRAEARVRELRAGRLLARQNLLPDAKVELGALNAGTGVSDLFAFGDLSVNNKLSGSATQSLLMVRERARLGLASVGLDISEWELALTRQQVGATLRIAAAEWRALAVQRALQQEAVADAEALVAGELRRFEAGESSLLIVNLRERALITERNALARIEGRLLAAAAVFQAALGRP
jgi:outer membrane protein